MGGRGGTAGGGQPRAAVPETLSKPQKANESRQQGIVKERDEQNRTAANDAVREAMNIAIRAAEQGSPGTLQGFSGSEIDTLAREVFNEARTEQKKGEGTGGITQVAANRIVSAAITKQANAYDKTSRAVESKLRKAYEKRYKAQGQEKPTTGIKRRQFDRVVSLAADNAMGRILSEKGFGARLKSTTLTPKFLRSNLNAAIDALR